jgi:hypothetical protein
MKRRKGKMAKKRWACECAVTMQEITAEVNSYRVKMGYRPLSSGKMYKIREMAAEAFLSLYPDGNTGLVKNPYIANRMIGRAYMFTAARAAKLVRLGVRYRQPVGAGRRIGFRMSKRRKALA